MAWTDACKVEAVAQIDKRKETSGGLRKALREISKESEIPYGTLKRWYYPEGVPNNGNTPPKQSIEKEPPAISDLHTLPYDSGRKKIKFCLRENNGEWTLSMQDYRMGRKRKDVATKNRLIIPLNLCYEFLRAMDAVYVVLREGASVESGGVGVGSDYKGDEVELQVEDNADDTQNNEQDYMESEPGLSPNGIPGKVEAIRCKGCRQHTPGTKLKDREMRGCCQSPALSWDGEQFQIPDKLHLCQNFCRHDQHTG